MRQLRALILLLLVVILPLLGCAKPPAGVPAAADGRPHVVLVSFDGMRADHLDRFAPTNFRRAAREGVRAESLIPVFPTKTFPNHYTIVTGLYTEHHGIVANMFWDSSRRQSYALGRQESVTDGTWYRGEPIWVTAERQGVKAACFFWPGSEAAIGGVRPSYWKTYDGRVENEARVDGVLQWLRMPESARPRMITLYFEDVDGAGHSHGPLSREARDAVMDVDRALGRLLDGISNLEIRRQVYVVLVSDHGMAESSPDRTLQIPDLIDTRGIQITDPGPTANLHVGGQARAVEIRDQLNAKLRHGRAYLRAEVPARLHYNSDPRIGDVVIIMEEGWMVSTRVRDPNRFPAGMHGWDPALPSMHGIFLVSGPGVPKGRRIGPVENIDIHPFLAELLQIAPAAGIDGRAGRLRAAVFD